MAQVAVEIGLEVVNLLLQYLSPLDGALPPHLVSTSLLQRHHFLNLSTDDPASYLCWPSSDEMESRRVVELLEILPPAEDADPMLGYPVRYTSDGEYTYAHVHIASAARDDEGVRLIFQWDPNSRDSPEGGASWKYHDAKLMPFPPQASTSLPGVDSTNALSNDESMDVQDTRQMPWTLKNGEGQDDDDSYWDSYGYTDDTSPGRTPLRNGSIADDKGEDAYWAQYGSVQGTADSTIPSPYIPNRRKLHPPSQPLPIQPGAPRPLSPNNLALRLTGLSPRVTPPPFDSIPSTPPIVDSHDDTCESEIADGITRGYFDSQSDGSNTLSPPENDPKSTSSPEDPQVQKAHIEITPSSVHSIVRPQNHFFTANADADEGLRTTIKGLYRLWMSGRASTTMSPDETKAGFLDIVNEACRDLL